MKFCVKSCLVTSLGLFFFYLIIQQIFTLRVEGFDNDLMQSDMPIDFDPITMSDVDRIRQLQSNNTQLKRSNLDDITKINNQKRRVLTETGVNAVLAADVAQNDVLLDTEKSKMSKEDAYNLVLHDKLKRTVKENHHMHDKIDKLDNEVTKKDDELSKIETELFKCIQTQVRHRPTHTPKPKQAVFGNVNFASKTLTL